MNLSARSKKILHIMLEETAPISIVKLSEKIGVSKRTVQRELEYLPKDLREFNLEFASKTGVGVWIVGEQQDKINLKNLIINERYTDDTDKEYRRKRIIFENLIDKSVKKLFWYSAKFKVSEATISSDLEVLEQWFKKFDLKVIKKPGSGISISGSEASYRKAIKAFISENIDAKFLLDMYEETPQNVNVFDEFQKSDFVNFLGEDIVSRVTECINCINSSHIRSLTEQSYIGLIFHISIAVKRILDKETIEENANLKNSVGSDDDYLIAKNIAFEIEEEFEISIPESEISYIYLHIKASKFEKIHSKFSADYEELKNIADEMIYAFDEKKAYMLKQDEEFLHSLLAHLAPTIVRLANGMKIYNPMLNEVKTQYSQVYEKCEKTAKILTKHVGKEIPESEIGFLTVHFAAALVRLESSKESTKIVNIGIVCSSGIGISRLMLSKLKNTFKNKVILTAYGKNDVTEKVIEKEDFLISSISLKIQNIEVAEVNPLITAKDVDKIRSLIDKYETQTKPQSKDKVTMELETISVLASQMRTIANEMKIYSLEIDINVHKAIDEISKIVCKEGENSETVANDILNREKISSQIYPELEFALFHAKSKGVKIPSFNIFTNKELKSFTSPDLKDIKIMFVMLIPIDENEKMNSEILGCISSSLVEDNSLIEAVLAGENDNAVKQVSQTLKVFFSEYILKLSE